MNYFLKFSLAPKQLENIHINIQQVHPVKKIKYNEPLKHALYLLFYNSTKKKIFFFSDQETETCRLIKYIYI